MEPQPADDGEASREPLSRLRGVAFFRVVKAWMALSRGVLAGCTGGTGRRSAIGVSALLNRVLCMLLNLVAEQRPVGFLSGDRGHGVVLDGAHLGCVRLDDKGRAQC